VAFGDYDDSASRKGVVPGVVGVAWICAEHLAAARQRAPMPAEEAIRSVRDSLGVVPQPLCEGKANPELLLIDVGRNRAKVFAIIREATDLSPEKARDLLNNVPAKISEGWPVEFEVWRQALCEAGAIVEICWD